MNFKTKSLSDDIPDWLKLDVGSGAITKALSINGNDLGEPYDKTDLGLLRIAIALLLLVVIFSGFSAVLSDSMKKKEQEAKSLEQEVNEQMILAEADNYRIQSRANDAKLVEEINSQNERKEDANKTKKAIPNLLNRLMYNIPEDARISRIENTEGNHIVIRAQATRYEQLGFFKAKIKSEQILTNVTSTGGDKEDGIITIKIEGDLP